MTNEIEKFIEFHKAFVELYNKNGLIGVGERYIQVDVKAFKRIAQGNEAITFSPRSFELRCKINGVTFITIV